LNKNLCPLSFADDIVWFQKISIPPPQRVIGSSQGEGVKKTHYQSDPGSNITKKCHLSSPKKCIKIWVLGSHECFAGT